jgi:hypothetical protein
VLQSDLVFVVHRSRSQPRFACWSIFILECANDEQVVESGAMSLPIEPANVTEARGPSADASSTAMGDDITDEGATSTSALILEARARRYWRNSPEYRRWTKAGIIGLAILALLGLTYYLDFEDIFHLVPNNIFLTIVAGIVVISLLFYRSSQYSAVSDRFSLSLDTAELQREEGEIGPAGTDFISLWLVTQKRIDLYHKIATAQAKASFLNGQIAAYAGFLVIVIVAGIAGVTQNATGAIAASVIGVAGAGLSAYIGATFMKAQAAASAQLREYFLQPVEFARVLAAERLIDKLEPQDRGPAVTGIIQSMTSARAAAPPKKPAL